MKCHHENTKTLERFLLRLQEQFKMRMRFAKGRVTESDLTEMTLDYLSRGGRTPISHNKENVDPSNCKKGEAETSKKNGEVERLKKQMRMEQELTRRFIVQITRDKLTQGNPSSSTPTTDLQSSLLTCDGSNAKVKPEPLSGQSRQKSRTFARLRKVQAVFCGGSGRLGNLKRRQSCASASSFHVQNGRGGQVLAQQNQSLRTIHNNLITHLSIMEKYRNIPGLEGLVRKEEQLRKKEVELRNLEEGLSRRELQLNRTHAQVLNRERSVKGR